MHPTSLLAERFASAKDDWVLSAGIFLNHFKGGYLADLVSRELGILARNPEHVINSGVNQYTLTPVSLPALEYSIRIVTPFASRRHVVKWLGMRQIIGMKGKGAVTIRKFRAPPTLRIERFEPGLVMEVVEQVEISNLDYVVAADKNELLDIDAVTEPSVLEILTFKADAGPMIWTFDEHLKSLYAEQALPVVSRFRNVANLAVALGREIPDDIYQNAMKSQNSRVALAALESLLARGGLDAFEALHDAIESKNDELREGAERLLGILTNPRRGVHAT